MCVCVRLYVYTEVCMNTCTCRVFTCTMCTHACTNIPSNQCLHGLRAGMQILCRGSSVSSVFLYGLLCTCVHHRRTWAPQQADRQLTRGASHHDGLAWKKHTYVLLNPYRLRHIHARTCARARAHTHTHRGTAQTRIDRQAVHEQHIA